MKTRKIKEGICTHTEGNKQITHYANEHLATKHTPTPWKVGSDSSIYGDEGHYFVATTQKRSDAEFIVRAVNSHDDLLQALISEHEGAGIACSEDCSTCAIIAKAEGR